jgi:hypothetical protein
MSLHASGWSSKPPEAIPLLMASERRDLMILIRRVFFT